MVPVGSPPITAMPRMQQPQVMRNWSGFAGGRGGAGARPFTTLSLSPVTAWASGSSFLEEGAHCVHGGALDLRCADALRRDMHIVQPVDVDLVVQIMKPIRHAPIAPDFSAEVPIVYVTAPCLLHSVREGRLGVLQGDVADLSSFEGVSDGRQGEIEPCRAARAGAEEGKVVGMHGGQEFNHRSILSSQKIMQVD